DLTHDVDLLRERIYRDAVAVRRGEGRWLGSTADTTDERRNRTMSSATITKKPCKHEPDPDSGQRVARLDGGWDIGVECILCGEFGYAQVWEEDVKWQDED